MDAVLTTRGVHGIRSRVRFDATRATPTERPHASPGNALDEESFYAFPRGRGDAGDAGDAGDTQTTQYPKSTHLSVSTAPCNTFPMAWRSSLASNADGGVAISIVPGDRLCSVPGNQFRAFNAFRIRSRAGVELSVSGH